MQLIGTSTCPFVHRALLLIDYKQIACEFKLIDLDNKPAWFQSLTPLRKVPLLLVQDTVIFESMVINDYLDEISIGSCYSSNPQIKAAQRSWSLFGNALISDYYRLLVTASQDAHLQHKEALLKGLSQVNDHIQPLLSNEESLSMLDIAYAPLFLRMKIIDPLFPLDLLKDKPVLTRWYERLMQDTRIITWVGSNAISERMIHNILNKEGLARQRMLENGAVQIG